MRNFFFMVFCMVALLLPENLWAQTSKTSADGKTTVTLDAAGTTLTITCNATAAAELSMVSSTVAMFSLTAEAKAAITTIKFTGPITSSDLSALSNANGFTGVTTVDMGDAHIVKSGGSQVIPSTLTWYQSTAGITPQVGTIAVIGGTLYQLSVAKSWVNVYPDTPWTELIYNSVADMNADTSQPGNTYAKIPSYMYCQLTVTNESWSARTTETQENAKDPSFLESERDNHLNEFIAGQSIRFKYYFRKVEDSDKTTYPTGKWEQCTESDYMATTGTKYPNMTGVNLDNLLNDRGVVGDGMWTYVYYVKQGTRTWSAGQTSAPSTFKTSNIVYSDRYGHEYDEGFNSGDWVKMLNGYSYYQYQYSNAAADRHWNAVSPQPTSKTNISKDLCFATVADMEANTTAVEGDYAVVPKNILFWDGTNWIDPNTVTMVGDYGEMKFSYWNSSLTTAITSKYAEETISNQIFAGCTSLTSVDFKGGNVTGFHDTQVTTASNHGTLTVTIGKNVTKISSNAFKECYALKTVNFDTDYTEPTDPSKDILTGVIYPKELIIEGEAFLQATYLSGEVKIPNRVKSIGDKAFKLAGNNASVDGAAADEQFLITFERRRHKDDESVSMDYDVDLVIGEKAFEQCYKLKTISMPIRLTSMGNGAFENSGLEHFIIREDVEDARIKVIPQRAFLGSKLVNITIPRSITEIQQYAFTECTEIKKVIFQKQHVSEGQPQETLIIRSGAFSGGNEATALSDVYVEFSPSERLIICEYDAFSFTSLVGQTDTQNSHIARLHFPSADWDYYAGDWKKGLAFRQENLDAIKSGYTDDSKGYVGKGTNANINYERGTDNAGKAMHAEADKQYTPANGWQQFVWTSTDIDIVIPSGSFMRTYSTKTPKVIPTYALMENQNPPSGHTADEAMLKIYRISYFDSGYKGSSSRPTAPGEGDGTPTATATEVVRTVSNRKYIPSNSGFIMTADVDASYLVYLSDIPIEGAQYPYENNLDNINANLLYPSCIDDQPGLNVVTTSEGSYVSLTPTIPEPYYGDQPDYRLFGLWVKDPVSSSCFSRVRGNMPRDKAYLKLPASLFPYYDEGESGGGGISGASSSGSAPVMLSFQDPEGNTTDVRMINPDTFREVDINAFYTLQGVKLNGRPTQQGIYIHNGKKVVIK